MCVSDRLQKGCKPGPMMEEHANLWPTLVVLEAGGSDGARRALRLLREERGILAAECGGFCLLSRYLDCMETVVRASAMLYPGPGPGPGARRRRSSQVDRDRTSPTAALQNIPREIVGKMLKRVWGKEDRRNTTTSACSSPRRASLIPHIEGRRATWGPATEEAVAVAKAWGCTGDFRRRRASCFASTTESIGSDQGGIGRLDEKSVVELAWGCVSPDLEKAAAREMDRRASTGRQDWTSRGPVSDKGLSVLVRLAEWARDALIHHNAGNKCYQRLADGMVVARASRTRSPVSGLPERVRCNTI